MQRKAYMIAGRPGINTFWTDLSNPTERDHCKHAECLRNHQTTHKRWLGSKPPKKVFSIKKGLWLPLKFDLNRPLVPLRKKASNSGGCPPRDRVVA